MIVKQFFAGPINANNYLLVDETTKDAVLIDCSEVKEEILETIKELGAKVKHIILTHGHFDHVLGVNEMKKRLECDVLIHKNDVEWLSHINEALPMFGLPPAEIPQSDGNFSDGDIIKFGNTEIKVIHTPGHTQGSVCFLVEGKLFSGDTLFKEAVGRVDLPGGSWSDIQNSIVNILFKLDNDTIVYPGHGDMTSIRYEKKFNREI